MTTPCFLQAAASAWNRFWFTPTAATNLGVCRLLFFGVVLLRYRLVSIDPTDTVAWANVPPVFWKPNPLLGALVLPVASRPVLSVLETFWTLALVCSCIGVITRISTVCAFLLSTYILWLPHNFGKLHHMDGLVVLIAGVLAASRCGDRCAVDSLLRQRAAHVRGPAPVSPAYTWPIRLVWLVMAMVFFEAGLSKLRYGGWDWIVSDNLSIMLVKTNYRAYTGLLPLTSWGLWLAQHHTLCRALAAVTVVLEVGYPITLLSRRIRIFWVPATLAAALGMFCLIVPAFVELILCHVFWVPWDWLQRAASHADV